MHKPIRLTFAAALAASVVAGTTGVAAAAPTCEWKGKELDAVAGTERASAVEANGDVIAGYGQNDGDERARIVTWDKNGKLTKDYGEIPSRGSATISDVSSDGTIIGYGLDDPWGAFGFISHNGKLTRLAGDDTNKSFPAGINEKGVVVGWVGILTDYRPAMWQADQPGKYKELTGLPKETKPVDIDEDGSILLKGDHGKHYVWRDGKTTELKIPEGTRTYVNKIANGHVIGSVWSKDSDGDDNHGIYWDKNGEPTVIKDSSSVSGVNKDGVIAGVDDESNRSGVWKQGKHVAWLGHWNEAGLEGISPDGTIVGDSDKNKVAMAWNCG